MFWPSSERYSTVACVPTVSFPSTLVLASTRNCTASAFCDFSSSTVNEASPIEEIFPLTVEFTEVEPPDYARVSRGRDQIATVKQSRNIVATERTVRNRIHFSALSFFSWGVLNSGTNDAKVVKEKANVSNWAENQADARFRKDKTWSSCGVLVPCKFFANCKLVTPHHGWEWGQIQLASLTCALSRPYLTPKSAVRRPEASGKPPTSRRDTR